MNARNTPPAFLFALAFPCIAMAQSASSLVVNEFMASNSKTLADGDGQYSDWIEIRNPTGNSVALSGCYLTDDANNLTKWMFPPSAGIAVPANGYLVVFASGNATGSAPYIDARGYIHTSFRLSASGESVALVNTDGTTVISAFWDYPEQGADVSYGRGANGTIGYFRVPTPGAANGDAGYGWVADTKFSVKRGFYTAPFAVEITTNTAGATIRYTLDGSTPTESYGTIYTGPITISGTTVLRAMAYKTGWFSTNVDTQTYLFLANVIAQPSTKPGPAWPDPYTGGGGPGGGTRQAIDYGMDSRITNDARYADLMDDALLAIPTFSIVTDLPNLFDSSTGIYMNPGGEGQAWERPVSVEFIRPDGEPGFQADAGLRIRGGVSTSKNNPKHSFRIVMRSEYGDAKIEYPLFGPEGASSFDKLDFRTAQNFSWNFSGAQYATWLEDPFSRDTMRDMGQPYTRGFFFHLYLNGVYWGLYQTEERPDGHFGQSYLGGDDDDYDVVKSDEDNGTMYATDGTITLYNNFWSLVNAGVSTNAAYFRLMGRNADGSVNAAYPRYLDVDNLIDYMLLVFFTGAQDMPLGPPNTNSMPRNLWAIASRVNPDGFKYLSHDNEWSLVRQSGVNINRVSASLGSALGNQNFFNPWWLHLRLKTNAEYVLRFADRVRRHFFNNGALTPAACIARYQARIDEINLAIIAESARWGDYLTPTAPRTRDNDWLPQVLWIRDSYFNASPQTRTAIVLSQLQSAGLYPSLAAPNFSQHGGLVNPGYNLVITVASGTIYYTTDGSDPRQIGGSVSPTALSGASGLSVPLITSTTVKARTLSGSAWSALTEASFVITGNPTSTPTPTQTPTRTRTPTPSQTSGNTVTPTATPSHTPAAVDTDKDGVVDSLESQWPSGCQGHLWLSDSDGDGLNDGAEDANRNGAQDSGETCVKDRDTDDDLFLDSLDVQPLVWNAGFTDADNDEAPDAQDPNPTNPDTDGDRFKDGYDQLYGNAQNAAVKPFLGDVNGDRYVTSLDALVVQTLFLQLIAPDNAVFDGPAEQDAFRHSDTNRDGYVTSLDALIVQSFFLELAPLLPL